MDLTICNTSGLKGVVHCPPNKSHSFRALMLAGLAEGASTIHSPAVSNDWMRGTEALEMFGARVTPKADRAWEVVGAGGALRTPDDIVDCGNSGVVLRLFMGLAACCEGYTVLSGDNSLRHIRLCGPMIDALNSLGAWAVSTKGDGHAPIVVRGRLKGGRAEIDGLDSQPVSALLLACSLAEAPSEIVVRRPGEKPYVAMTMDWMKRCGIEFSSEGFERFRVRGRSRWKGFETTIPLDWSAALYPIVAATLCPGSEVVLPGMDWRDSQGDKMVVHVLREMGASIDVVPKGVVARSSRLTGRVIDCNDFIDQFMLLAVVGACADGETTLTNAQSARHKECDRITEMARALKAMGAAVEEHPDGLTVRKSPLHGANLDSHDDHRMVMTLSVAAMAARGVSSISRCECVKKTFPDFAAQMRGIGADMQTG